MANYQQALERGIGKTWIGKSTKVCPNCKIEKPLREFAWTKSDGKYYPAYCQSCMIISSLKTYQSNMEKGLCRTCGKPRRESKSKVFCQNCLEKNKMTKYRNYYEKGGREKAMEWYENGGREHAKIMRKKWWESGGGRERQANYQRNRKQTDPNYYWRCWIATQTNRAFQGKMSDESSLQLLGLSIAEFQEYLGWLWPRDAKGEKLPREMVQVDHIIPLNYGYGKSDHVKSQLCHFTNLMPITSDKNQAKSGTFPEGFHGFWFEKLEQGESI